MMRKYPEKIYIAFLQSMRINSQSESQKDFIDDLPAADVRLYAGLSLPGGSCQYSASLQIHYREQLEQKGSGHIAPALASKCSKCGRICGIGTGKSCFICGGPTQTI